MDKILITNLRAYGIIGVYGEERIKTQEILINITLYTDTRYATKSDSLDNCVDYDALSQKIKKHAESAKRLTVEALAEDLAQICLEEEGVEKIKIRVEKPEAIEFVEKVGVEIKRAKGN